MNVKWTTRAKRMPRLAVCVVIAALVFSACGNSTAHLEVATPASGTPRPAAAFLAPQATPRAVTFPADDGPHNDLTEWWYYTGHLTTASGNEYGFEFVIFQGDLAGFAKTYAAHFAITDVSQEQFHYDQRTQLGNQPSSSNVIDLHLGDWSLVGSGSRDQITAKMAGYALKLTVASQKAPALHNGDGYFEWAPATGSYYYSRTSLDASGTLAVDGIDHTVTGQAWMDHQWGNFLLVGGGGWDWFAIQLNTGQQIMLWHSRNAQNKVIFGSGTWVDETGETKKLLFQDFNITATGTWTSPHTGATYPSGWTVDIPSQKVQLSIVPVMKDQELNTRQTTGVVYWEGDVRITGTEEGQSIAGQGYVELTGYASTVP